jgi:RHS repeat-associated protein
VSGLVGRYDCLARIGSKLLDTGTYGAFGDLIASSGSTENAYGFAGEQFDSGLDQYYLRARYYDQESGRFTRRDLFSGVILEPITLHKYLYANNSPVNGIDPSGFATTLSEIQSIFTQISALAARTYASLATPSTIATVRAYVAFIAFSGITLKATQSLIEGQENEQNQNGQNRGVVLDQDDPRRMNQMRVQLQNRQGATHAEPSYNVPEIGVTVSQIGESLWTLWITRKEANWFPSSHETAMIKGMSSITKTAERARQSGGVAGVNTQIESFQWMSNDPKGNKRVSRGDYRVELENLRGHNLRY